MLILWGLSRILFFSWLPHGKHWYIIPMGSIDTLYIYHFWNPSNLKTEHNIYNIFNWLPNEESGGWRLWFSVNYKILNESYTFLYRKSDAPWAPENRWKKTCFGLFPCLEAPGRILVKHLFLGCWNIYIIKNIHILSISKPDPWKRVWESD